MRNAQKGRFFAEPPVSELPSAFGSNANSHSLCECEFLQTLLRHKNRGRALHVPCFYGGESEIRTHGTVLAFTRFPVVRLRPAQPSLHIDLTIISQEKIKIKSFFKKILKIVFYSSISSKISSSIMRGLALPLLFDIALPIMERIAKLFPRL